MRTPYKHGLINYKEKTIEEESERTDAVIQRKKKKSKQSR